MLASRATSIFFTYSLRSRNLKVNVLHLFGSKRMGTEKPVSSLSKSGSSASKCKKNKEVKRYIDCTMESEASADDEAKTLVEMETQRHDLSKLEAMTVKELRIMMRDAGLPIKGSKKDLVSALGSFLLVKECGEDMASASQQPDSMKAQSKGEVKVPRCENIAIVSSESSGTKRKNRGNKKLDVYSSPSHQSKSDIKEENLSVKRQVCDIKMSCTSRKVSLRVENEIIESMATEPWEVLTHKKPQPGWVPYNPKILRPPPLPDNVQSVKMMSWNVNGLRALLKLEASAALQLAQRENFDVLCLQETKMQEKDIDKIKERLIDGYDNSFWTCSISKLGYSGTAVISRIKPISVKYGLGIVDHDSEGRLVTVEFDGFYLLCGYVPNSGDGLRRLTYRVNEWDPSLSNYMIDLEKSKPVILTGDLNCAHDEIDIYNPSGNRRSAGFTNEERESFQKNFLSRGFVDTFRRQHPSVVGYTYYGYRHGGRKTNKGWRLDYFLVSESIADKVHDSYILPDVSGSDHCPIGLILKL